MVLAGGAAAATLAVLWYLRKASRFVCKAFVKTESPSCQNAKYDMFSFVQKPVRSRQAKNHGAAEDDIPLKAQDVSTQSGKFDCLDQVLEV